MRSAAIRAGGAMAALALLIGIGVAATTPVRRPACALVLHVGVEGWQRAHVISESSGELAVFTPAAGELRMSPLRYGPHRLCLELHGHPAIWAKFYRSDTGVRRRVEIYLEPTANGVVRFREVVNGKRTVFTGTVRPEDTSRERPFILEWI